MYDSAFGFNGPHDLDPRTNNMLASADRQGEAMRRELEELRRTVREQERVISDLQYELHRR